MAKMIIEGGNPLHGTVTPVANKNTIIKLIPACLLTDETVTIHNVPMSTDVINACKILEKLGGSVEKFNNDTSLRINCSKVNSRMIDAELSDKMKASVMFLGPLLIRFGKAQMPTPQGCKLGTRPMDAMIDNMVRMGAKYEHTHGAYHLEAEQLRADEIRQRFPSVTGTENLILTACKTPGTTIIQNAACEPHTQELCEFLVSMGAKISWIGSNRLEIQWVKQLSWTERTVRSDHLDVGGFIAAAVMTEGELTIKNAVVNQMGMILQVFAKFGVRVEINREKDEIFVPKDQHLVVEKTIKGDLYEIQALHRPLYPVDLIHTAVVLALKAQGNIMFRNAFYEYSFFFVQQLAKMKAITVLADPTKVVTFGPTEFKPAKMICSDIIQASYAMVLAALAADGKSELLECDSIFRRYPNIVEQFTKLGAKMEVVS
jgi:UDP-N-acetylglucosamine 1-carboxyvinyltransferase